MQVPSHLLILRSSLQSTLLFLELSSIREELRCGEEYWALERKLCGGTGNKIQVYISCYACWFTAMLKGSFFYFSHKIHK